MQAAAWLTLALTLTLAQAEGDFLMPGVTVIRPKRRGSAILFPDTPLEPRLPPGPVPLPVGHDQAAGDLLEEPEDMDLNNLDLASLDRINAVDNITDFANLFGLRLPDEEELPVAAHRRTSQSSPSSRLGNTRAVSEMATMARCKPELQTVPLDLPVEPNTYYYPTCVRLERCGGCCLGHLLTCRPKVTKVVTLKVLRTEAKSSSNSARSRSNSPRQRRRRRRRQSVPTFHEVEAIKHVQCECGCKVQPQDCNSAIHNYIERECSCVCKNKDEKKKCESQGDKKYWDARSCSCFCRRPVDCSSGELFSHESCRCERVVARAGFDVDFVEVDTSRRRPLNPRPVRIPLLPDDPFTSRRSMLVATPFVL